MKRILVTGSAGMLGKAVCKSLKSPNNETIELTRDKVDLRNSEDTLRFFSKNKPDLVVHCAALVGGISANIDGGSKYFLENIELDRSVLYSARELKINDLIYIGSSCMYPANVAHPLNENEILTGALEPTNANYALAKIVGLNITRSIATEDGLNWRVFVASNLYGPHDYFNPNRSHLLAAIIQKAIEAKENNSKIIEMWGNGKPRREFTYVDDFANWIALSSKFLNQLPIMLNTGIGIDYSVKEFYEKVLVALDLDVEIVSNPNKPSGNMRKLMDSSLAKEYGWLAPTDIDTGIAKTIDWYLKNRVVI
jgi:GDP-L-fucose synthase